MDLIFKRLERLLQLPLKLGPPDKKLLMATSKLSNSPKEHSIQQKQRETKMSLIVKLRHTIDIDVTSRKSYSRETTISRQSRN